MTLPTAGSPERAREAIARGAEDMMANGFRMVIPAALLAEAWPDAADRIEGLRQMVGGACTVAAHEQGAVIVRHVPLKPPVGP